MTQVVSDDKRFPPAINRLFEFVHAVHKFGVRNPNSGTIERFGTPKAISDINAVLYAGRINSVRARLRQPKPPIKRKRKITP